MFILALVWTALVWGIYLLAGAAGDLLAPVTAWLAAHPEIAAFVDPVLGALGALGLAGTVLVWIAGLGVLLLARLAFGGRRSRPMPWERFREEWGEDRPRRRTRNRRRKDDDDDDDDDDEDDDDDDDDDDRRRYGRRRDRRRKEDWGDWDA